MVLLWIIIPLFFLYSILIIGFWRAWRSIPEYDPQHASPQTRISVIVPARNEENNIGLLLSALRQQTYSPDLFEIIVVDDHSEDKTAAIVRQFEEVKLVTPGDETDNAYKKKAIEKGIAAATGNLIVTTDADCFPPPEWLHTIASFKEEKRAAFIAAPVAIRCNNSILQIFQAMDFMVLQGITGATGYKKKLSMCNGANLAYEKNAFQEVGGFGGIDHIASGDDMLLMYKIARKYPGEVYYLRSVSAIVETRAEPTWKSFINQRIRWASKARKYQDKRILPILVLVYLFNLCFLLLLIAGCWDFRYWILLPGLWLMKTLVELPFFSEMARFFNKRWAVNWFFFFQPVHILYTIAVGLLGQSGKYEWKGRRVR